MSLEWEHIAFRPDHDEFMELAAIHGQRKAVRLLDSAAQRAHRLSTVEADLADDQTLLDWHRERPR